MSETETNLQKAIAGEVKGRLEQARRLHTAMLNQSNYFQSPVQK